MHTKGSGKLNRESKGNFKRGDYKHAHLNKSSHGFTLIELMIIVMIIAILAAIAIPSYRRYVVINAEHEAQAKMMQLQLQLERWRSSALTYKGFQPQKLNTVNGTTTTTYAYDDNDNGTDNTTIYVPSGSDETNYRYQITLVDGTDTDNSLATDPDDDVDNITGRMWKMLAIPNSTGVTSNAHTFMMISTGMRCQSKDDDVDIESSDCGTGNEDW